MPEPLDYETPEKGRESKATQVVKYFLAVIAVMLGLMFAALLGVTAC